MKISKASTHWRGDKKQRFNVWPPFPHCKEPAGGSWLPVAPSRGGGKKCPPREYESELLELLISLPTWKLQIHPSPVGLMMSQKEKPLYIYIYLTPHSFVIFNNNKLSSQIFSKLLVRECRWSLNPTAALQPVYQTQHISLWCYFFYLPAFC